MNSRSGGRNRARKPVAKSLVLAERQFLYGGVLRTQPDLLALPPPVAPRFIFIITFHILCFFAAVAMVGGLEIAAGSSQLAGKGFYYLLLVTGGSPS